MEITGTLLDDAATFAIQATSGSRVEARNNTIVNAGDCGILVTGDAVARVDNSIIHDSVNYGIARTAGGTLEPGARATKSTRPSAGAAPT